MLFFILAQANLLTSLISLFWTGISAKLDSQDVSITQGLYFVCMLRCNSRLPGIASGHKSSLSQRCRYRRSGNFYSKLKCYTQVKKRFYALGNRFLVNCFWEAAKYPSSLEERWMPGGLRSYKWPFTSSRSKWLCCACKRWPHEPATPRCSLDLVDTGKPSLHTCAKEP